MHLLVLGAFWMPGVSHPLWPGKTSYRIASGRQSTPPTSKHKARISDFSLRLLVSPRTACGADFAPEIASLIGVSPDRNTPYL